MRDFLRLIALALVVFAITFLAFMFSNPEASRTLGQRLGLSERLDFTDRLGLSEGSAANTPERLTESERILRLGNANGTRWDALLGFPSTSQIRFDIPKELQPVRAQLQLDLQSELIAHGDGLVRVQVNGNLVDAILLEPGRAEHRLTYNLSPLDIATGEILVTLEGNGTTNYGQVCPTNVTNLGSIVQVLPSTAVMLEVVEPLSDPEVYAELLPSPLQIEAEGDVVPAAWASQWLTRQGVAAEITGTEAPKGISVMPTDGEPPITLAEDKLSVAGPTGLSELLRLRGGSLPSSYGQSWPLPVSALTTDILTHTFRASTRWQLNYKLADLPEGRAPDALELHLKTSQLRGENYWSLRVVLNGMLVNSTNHPGTGNDLLLSVPLPADYQRLTNQLVVTLVDNTPNQGICRAGPEQAAQLLPSTTLTSGNSPQGDAQILVHQLAVADRVGLQAADGSGLETAVQLAGMLDLLLPLDTPVDLAGGQGQVAIRAGHGERLAGLLQEVSQSANILVVWGGRPPDGVSSELNMQRVVPNAPPPQVPAGSTGLIVTW